MSFLSLTTPGGACGEVACAGWLAASCSIFGFGSFGALVKSEAAKSVDIDPLVFQSYKTGMCFITAWIALFLGIIPEFTFSPWGIVSGLFWVPGGIAAIAAIKLAGLAIGVAVGCSLIVLVSFVWGIIIFQEHVNSIFGACVGVLMMIGGFIGMTLITTAAAEQQDKEEYIKDTIHSSSSCRSSDNYNDEEELQKPLTAANETTSGSGGGQEIRQRGNNAVSSYDSFDKKDSPHESRGPVLVWGKSVNRTHLGIALASFNGLWGGSQTVPMKFCPDKTSGVGFLMSFAIGASLVTLSLWVLRFLYHLIKLKSAKAAYHVLPSFHFKEMLLPGCLSGLLWSFGNFFSFISVYYLGQGVGYSVTQASMLVSGVLGIFYFKEIQGTATISKWFMFAILTVSGILVLSYEKHGH